jgi:sugar phosphate isomerase/epimerase
MSTSSGHAAGSRTGALRERVGKPRSLQFSLAHLTLMSQPPPELIEIACAAGYDFVGLRLIPFGLGGEPVHALESNPRLMRATRQALQDTGVRLLDMELARIHAEMDVKQYEPALVIAAELGARHVLTSVWSGDAAYVKDQFAELCDMAQPLGLTVDLEYVPYAQVSSLAQAAALVSSSSRGNAGICIDTLHFSRAKDQLSELARLPRTWFHYAQICDAPAQWPGDDAELRYTAREGRLFLGQGGIDVRGILRTMPEMPYSIELPNSGLLEAVGPEKFARLCLETARDYLKSSDRAISSRVPDRDSRSLSDRAF